MFWHWRFENIFGLILGPFCGSFVQKSWFWARHKSIWLNLKDLSFNLKMFLILKTTIDITGSITEIQFFFSCCMWVILPKNGRSVLFRGKMKFILFEAFLAVFNWKYHLTYAIWFPYLSFNITSWFPNFRWRNIPFWAVLSKNWDFIMFLAKKRKVGKFIKLYLYHVINLSSTLMRWRVYKI